MTIAVVGSINADLLLKVRRLPRPGETVLGRSGDVQPGGKGANQALAARLAGAEVTMVGACGDDPNADAALRLLRQADVHLDHVQVASAPTGLAVVTTDERGENCIVVSPGANALVDRCFVAGAAAGFMDASIVIVQGEIPADAVDAVAERTAGRLVVNLAPVIAMTARVLRQADPLVVNEIEAVSALNILEPDAAASSNGESLAGQLLAAGARSIVITLGAAGCIVATPESTHRVRSPQVTAVDTVGAGDAFVGALCARLDDGDDLITAARFAARFAAASVRYPGAQQSYPTDLSSLPE